MNLCLGNSLVLTHFVFSFLSFNYQGYSLWLLLYNIFHFYFVLFQLYLVPLPLPICQTLSLPISLFLIFYSPLLLWNVAPITYFWSCPVQGYPCFVSIIGRRFHCLVFSFLWCCITYYCPYYISTLSTVGCFYPLILLPLLGTQYIMAMLFCFSILRTRYTTSRVNSLLLCINFLIFKFAVHKLTLIPCYIS